jgi:hypothetical protein
MGRVAPDQDPVVALDRESAPAPDQEQDRARVVVTAEITSQRQIFFRFLQSLGQGRCAADRSR